MKDAKTISIFATLFIYGILVTIWGIRLEGRVDGNAKDVVYTNKDITEMKSELKAYKGLPAKVDIIDKKVEKNAKITRAIYLGLVAKRIIQPDPNL